MKWLTTGLMLIKPNVRVGQFRHSDRTPNTSGLPRLTDILGVRWHVSNAPPRAEVKPSLK